MISAATGIALLACALHTSANATGNTDITASNTTSTNMAVFDETLPPIGFVRFCKFLPQDCAGTFGEAVRVVMNNNRWADLKTVNDAANQSVEAVSDMDLYNVIEHWTYPQGKGDCEDYVLLKRKQLMTMGWPSEALLITVVRDQNGDGHAVLTVSTNKGDFVLDNQNPEILAWHATGYTYYKRQSQSDPTHWVSLKPGTETAALKNTANVGQ